MTAGVGVGVAMTVACATGVTGCGGEKKLLIRAHAANEPISIAAPRIAVVRAFVRAADPPLSSERIPLMPRLRRQPLAVALRPLCPAVQVHRALLPAARRAVVPSQPLRAADRVAS